MTGMKATSSGWPCTTHWPESWRTELGTRWHVTHKSPAHWNVPMSTFRLQIIPTLPVVTLHGTRYLKSLLCSTPIFSRIWMNDLRLKYSNWSSRRVSQHRRLTATFQVRKTQTMVSTPAPGLIFLMVKCITWVIRWCWTSSLIRVRLQKAPFLIVAGWWVFFCGCLFKIWSLKHSGWSSKFLYRDLTKTPKCFSGRGLIPARFVCNCQKIRSRIQNHKEKSSSFLNSKKFKNNEKPQSPN